VSRSGNGGWGRRAVGFREKHFIRKIVQYRDSFLGESRGYTH